MNRTRRRLRDYWQAALRIASGGAVLWEEDSKLRVNHSASGFCLRAQHVMNGSQLAPPQSAEVAQGKPQLHRQNPLLLGAAARVSGWDARISACGSEIKVLIERSGIRYVRRTGAPVAGWELESGVAATAATPARRRINTTNKVFDIHSVLPKTALSGLCRNFSSRHRIVAAQNSLRGRFPVLKLLFPGLCDTVFCSRPSALQPFIATASPSLSGRMVVKSSFMAYRRWLNS